jgi:hypothetical protein
VLGRSGTARRKGSFARRSRPPVNQVSVIRACILRIQVAGPRKHADSGSSRPGHLSESWTARLGSEGSAPTGDADALNVGWRYLGHELGCPHSGQGVGSGGITLTDTRVIEKAAANGAHRGRSDGAREIRT